MKYLHYNQILANTFFWRTKQQQEIDYIEEREGKIFAYEFKWRRTKKTKSPALFKQTYHLDFQFVNKENFQDFLTK